ncbi:arylesterase [Salegentibacter flavus]|uniref:Acyl-CoA thioesterase-1 n=1 Tax=Salegentibacter flavus TaxID=287099 RepID=A0A1I5C9D4_9FLAO|nr:arylesterase [Salegentibacter flavus]SFN83422.1 acyl-CoA thioesterase-1 [Salegentibacter flavus]
MRNMPILTIFLSFLLLTSCGESAEKEEKGPAEETAETDLPQKNEEEKTILFFGTSLTAGLGLEPEQAYPAVIQQKLDSLGLDYEVVNAGLSGETTASGRNRINWVLNQNVDVFVLELGANDGLRGVPLEETRKNLREIIEIVREKNPDTRIILAGMQIPPNMGEEYTSEFRNIFPELAEEYDLEMIPFLLEDVAGIPNLNQQDGIHPTAEGQKIMAENVWEVLESELPE